MTDLCYFTSSLIVCDISLKKLSLLVVANYFLIILLAQNNSFMGFNFLHANKSS